MWELLKPFWGGIVKYGAIAVGLFMAWLQVRKSGEEAIKQKNIENTLEGVETRDKIENNVNSANDNKLASLRDKWER